MIGQYCKRDISRTAWRIPTKLLHWTCMESALDDFDHVRIMRILMSCSGMRLVDTVNAISQEWLDGFRPNFTSGLVWTVPRMSLIACKLCAVHPSVRPSVCPDVVNTISWERLDRSNQTSPVDLYGQCLGWVRSRANYGHINELSVRPSVWMLWTWSLQNGLTDSDHTSLVDLYGQCLGWVRSRATYPHINDLFWHVIGWYWNAISRERLDGFRSHFASGLVWLVLPTNSITCKLCAY